MRELNQHIETLKNVGNLKEGMNNMLSMMKKMLVLIITIAILLGVVIIYNLGILSYTEKEYQFATLKVLGFRDEQIEDIFVKQNNWIALVSVVIGLPLGYCLTDWLFRKAIEENYDFRAFRPFMATIRSPCCRPPFSAGEPGLTSETSAPWRSPLPNCLASSSSTS